MTEQEFREQTVKCLRLLYESIIFSDVRAEREAQMQIAKLESELQNAKIRNKP